MTISKPTAHPIEWDWADDGSSLSGGKAPAYLLSNLGGNITRTRKRLEKLQRRAAS